jgi:tRNA pseudouridine55 synthase
MMVFDKNSGTDLQSRKDIQGLNTEKICSSPEGVLPLNKPKGVSSFRMVQLMRRLLNIKKVGHTGTLDPFASGVLVVCAGRSATRLIPQLMDGDKEYEATLQLGVTTDTQDPEGRVIDKRPVPDLNQDEVIRCLEKFSGEQLQTPPSYSALKHMGKPLYYYARRGIRVEKKPRLIVIKNLQCLAVKSDTVTIKVVCTKGTYIRTLAADIGEALGCGAHLKTLTRTRNGFFSLAQTLDGKKLFADRIDRSALAAHLFPVDMVQELLADN